MVRVTTPIHSVMYDSRGWPAERAGNGAATYVERQVRSLGQLGVDGNVYARIAQGPASEAVYTRDHYYRHRGMFHRAVDLVVSKGPRRYWLAWREPAMILRAVRDAVRQRGVQVVEMEEVWGMAGHVARWSPVPVVLRLHGPWFLVGPAMGLEHEPEFHPRVAAEGRAMGLAAGVTAPSHYVLDAVRRRYGLPLEHAEVIPNPASPVAPEERWRIDAAEPRTVLFVGRFDRCKGGDCLLRAFRLLAQVEPEARLVWAGPDAGFTDEQGRAWTLPEYLAHAIPEASIRSRVELLGFQTPAQIAVLRRRARLSVVCSRFETFSMVAVEAMAAGSPLVSSATGGTGEVVEHERTAITCDPADAQAFAAAMLRVIRDDELTERLSRDGVSEVERRFDPLAVARQTLAYYQRIVDAHGA